MGDIKSAYEIAMEKINKIENATPEERVKWKFLPQGEQMATKYLKEDVNLLLELNKYQENERKYVAQGAVEVMARNIDLPRNDAIKKTNRKAMDGIKLLKKDKSGVENIFSNMRRIFDHFTSQGEQQRRQAYEQLKADFVARIQQAAQQQLAEQSRGAMKTVGMQGNALAGQALAAVNAMQDAVASMRAITLDSTRRMENSAETLAIAADDFAKAGGSVVTVAKEAGSMSEKLVGAAQVLSASISVIRNAQDGYETASKVVADMVAELRIMVDTARQEAGVSRELVGHLRESAVQLSAAQSSVDGYFEQVCEELAKAHQAFGENVESTLKRSNGAFQKELKDAVDYLKAAVEELGDVADAIPAHKR